ncbi:MAG: Holliday junction branch migration protein RuvA [Candidatus Krumholzibacteriota bacterium]
MIAFLEGTLVTGGTEAVVSVGGGIGLDVQLSSLSAEQLPAPGEPVRLWTHLAVREDNWSLYGFVEAEERSMFRLLISVSGVGPKVALGMLSRASGRDIASYLRTGDEKSLTRLPGIGKKSAARLVVELGQRVPEADLGEGPAGISAGGAPDGMRQALAAMGAMGLAPARAEQALLRARQVDDQIDRDLERWVKAALQNL